MGANDSPPTTRSIVTNYFNWRLNNETITNNRAFTLVRRIAADSEAALRNQQPTFHFSCPISPLDQHILNNIQSHHQEIARELFVDGVGGWGRIIAFIMFSALLAENIIDQHPDDSSRNLVISSLIDWTTDYIDTEFQEWLQNQNYWSGFLKSCDKTPQRRNSISRYAGILGTLGMLTLGALYMRRT